MTDATGTDDVDPNEVASRAELLPEERAAGSAAPTDQAEIILEESEARTENEAVGIRDDNVASEPD